MDLGHDPIAGLRLEVKVTDQGLKPRLTILTTNRNRLTVRFYYHVISCALAWRGVRRGRSQLQQRSRVPVEMKMC